MGIRIELAALSIVLSTSACVSTSRAQRLSYLPGQVRVVETRAGVWYERVDGPSYGAGSKGLVAAVDGNPAAVAAAKRSRKARIAAAVLGGLGGVAAASAIVTFSAGHLSSQPPSNPERLDLAIAGLFVGSAVSEIVGLGLASHAERQRWNAIDIYNQSIEAPPLEPASVVKNPLPLAIEGLRPDSPDSPGGPEPE